VVDGGLDVVDGRSRRPDSPEPLEADAVGVEPGDRPPVVQRVAEFRQGAGGAVDGDDGVAVQHDQRVPGVAEAGGDRGGDNAPKY